MDPNQQQPASSPQPVTAQVVGPAYPPIYVRRSSPFRTLVVVLLAIVLVPLVLLMALAVAGAAIVAVVAASGYESETHVQEKHFSHEKSAQDKVAIITVEGVIVGDDEFIKRQIDQAKKDENVKAVVLRVDSPGGTISGSDYFHHRLRQLAEERKIPLVVSMGGLAASGGYYVSMAVGDTPDSIFAEPTTWTGSIGVIIPLYQAAELLESWGIQENSIASGPLKEMGSFTKPMTEAEREVFEHLVAESFARFKDVIKSGRPKFQQDPDALDRLATGQVYTAEQALESGMIDKIGFVEEAVDRAIELAGLDKDNVRVVRYAPELSFSDLFVSSRVKSPTLELAARLKLGSPQAYYLWTRLPPLVESGP